METHGVVTHETMDANGKALWTTIIIIIITHVCVHVLVQFWYKSRLVNYNKAFQQHWPSKLQALNSSN